MPQKRNKLGVFIKTGKYNKCEVCNNCFYVKNCHNNRKFCSKECYWKSLKGKKQSKEHIENARITRIGKKRSIETRKKIGEAHIGEKNWSWRGGISIKRKRKFSQAKHREWRNKVFKRDYYTCQKCSKKGGYLEAHHIKPFAYFPKLRYTIKNGITLCRGCHIKETIKERKINWSNQFVKRKIDLDYWK